MKNSNIEKRAVLFLQIWNSLSLAVVLTFWLSVLLHYSLGGDYLYETFIVEAMDTLAGIVFVSFTIIVLPGVSLIMEVKDQLKRRRTIFTWLSCGFAFLTSTGIFWVAAQRLL